MEKYVSSSKFHLSSKTDDIRLVPGLGGGALYDLGCYCVNFQRLMLGREPIAVQARYHERLGCRSANAC